MAKREKEEIAQAIYRSVTAYKDAQRRILVHKFFTYVYLFASTFMAILIGSRFGLFAGLLFFIGELLAGMFWRWHVEHTTNQARVQQH